MLQIIGSIGCAYLLLKGFEIIGSQGNRVSNSEGAGTRISVPSTIAAIIAFAGAVIFPLILANQAGAFNGSAPGAALTQTQVDCINNAGSDTNRILNCTK